MSLRQRLFLNIARLAASRCFRIWCATHKATGGTFAKKIGKATTKPLKMGKGCSPNISSQTKKESGLSPSGTEAQLRYCFQRTTNPQYPQVLLWRLQQWKSPCKFRRGLPATSLEFELRRES